jgi:nucleoside-diphosphate-sugar epimerase
VLGGIHTNNINFDNLIIRPGDRVLITGAGGFIGSKVVETVLAYGFTNLRCLVRPSGDLAKLNNIISLFNGANVELLEGNLLSVDDCRKATKNVSVIFHLAAGIEKTFPGCFMNSAVTTRNLLDAVVQDGTIRRFVNVSSFAVYSNVKIRRRGVLNETCELETKFMERYDSYCFGKAKQDQIVMEYGRKHNIPFVIVRPGVVYGPKARAVIHSRVGIGTFGIFLHLGGPNRIPLTYIDNCADAIVLAGVRKGVDGEVFNIVDDFLPTSRKFLRMYKKNVKYFKSIYMPYRIFYLLCYLWEKYSKWSDGQLPLAFNRRKCSAEWKGNRYPNTKAKELLGWNPKVSIDEGLTRHFEYFKRLET